MDNQNSSSSASSKKAGESRDDRTFEKITGLSEDEALHVFSLLTLKDKVALASTSRCHYALFGDHLHAAKCLMLVSHGDEEAAHQMLLAHPQLLSERTEVTDYSGRTFKNIN